MMETLLYLVESEEKLLEANNNYQYELLNLSVKFKLIYCSVLGEAGLTGLR